jgi:hypothetical protein
MSIQVQKQTQPRARLRRQFRVMHMLLIGRVQRPTFSSLDGLAWLLVGLVLSAGEVHETMDIYLFQKILLVRRYNSRGNNALV